MTETTLAELQAAAREFVERRERHVAHMRAAMDKIVRNAMQPWERAGDETFAAMDRAERRMYTLLPASLSEAHPLVEAIRELWRAETAPIPGYRLRADGTAVPEERAAAEAVLRRRSEAWTSFKKEAAR